MVVWAGNHWPLAVETHRANHPRTTHVCQDLQQANWHEVPAHDLLLASPACQGHTKARGKDRPHHDADRATAWAVVSCAEVHLPEVVVVENVTGFLKWVLYGVWVAAMEALGYTMSLHVVDASDFGVPQNRERLFLIFTRSKAPFLLKGMGGRVATVRPLIQWDAFTWSPIERPGRSKATLARAAAGRKAFGRRFVMPYYGRGSGDTGRSLDRPIGTITTRDRWAVVDGDRMRMLQVPEYRAAMGFPSDYKLPDNRAQAIHLLGNAVCPPVATEIVRQLKAAA